MNGPQHLYLILLWITFCIHHSFFAGQWWKYKMQRLLGRSFRYYRFFYSVFAILYLIPLVYLQCTIQSVRLWKTEMLLLFSGAILLLSGLTIMLICIRSYFFDVTGIKAFATQHSRVELKTDGLHSLVRHPLYFGTLLFIWGCFFLFPLASNLIACSLITVYVIAGIEIEERKLIAEFGDGYKLYAGKVPKLIPRFFILKGKLRQRLSETR